MRQVHHAGEKLFVDYAGQSVPYGREGDRAQTFVAVLGASNYTFACATAHLRLEDWTGALVRTLEFIQGVPALIVPNNARALIADPDLKIREARQHARYEVIVETFYRASMLVASDLIGASNPAIIVDTILMRFDGDYR